MNFTKQLLAFVSLFSALGFGQASIQNGVTPPTLSGGSVSSIAASCAPATIAIGQTAQCSGTAFVQNNPTNDVTNIGLWSSLTPSTASVSSSGLVTALAGGVATISFNLGESAFIATTTIYVGTPPVILATGMTGCPPPNGSGSQCVLPSGAVNGAGYSYTFSGTGGVQPYSWTIDAGTSTCLSGSGFSLATSGLFSATSAVTGTWTCTIDLTDSEPFTNTLSVQIVVTAGGAGPPNYLGYQGSLIMPNPIIPNIGGLTNNGASVTDNSYNVYGGVPAGNLTIATRCTDSVSAAGATVNQSLYAGEGGSGSVEVINHNSTMMRVEDLGNHGRITMLTGSPKRCTAPTGGTGVASGIMITLQQNSASRGSNGTSNDFGTGSFDLQDPTVYWEFGSSQYDFPPGVPANNVQHHKYTFNTATGDYTVAATPSTDFTFALPIGANAPEITVGSGGVLGYDFGAYGTHTLHNLASGNPEYKQWIASTAYALGDLIVPGDSDGYTHGNPNNCAFKVQTAGTTGTSEPNFNTNGPCANTTATDGGVTWKGIVAPAQFVFQAVALSSPGCRTPTASLIHPYSGTPPLHPDLGSTFVTSGTNNLAQPCTITWENSGPSLTQFSNNLDIEGGGRVSYDQTTFGFEISTNTYGGACDPNAGCPTRNYTTQANGDQDTGFWAAMAKIADPVTGKPTYYLMNAVTGIQTNWTCGTGTLGTCGTIGWSVPGPAFNAVVNLDGQGLATSNCAFTLHGIRLLGRGDTIDLSIGKDLFNPGHLPCVIPQDYMWRPTDVYDVNKNMQMLSHDINHGGEGMDHRMGWNSSGYPATSGVQLAIYPSNNASGNNGGLPQRCGSNTTPCLLFSGGTQPVFNLPPYSFSIANNCQSTLSTANTGYRQPISAASASGGVETITLANSSFVFPVGAVLSVTGITVHPELNAQNVAVSSSGAGTFTFSTAAGNVTGTIVTQASNAYSYTSAWNLIPATVYGTLPANYSSGGNSGAPDCNIATSTDSHPSWAYNPGLTDNGVSLGSVLSNSGTSLTPFTAYIAQMVGMTLTVNCTPGTVGTPPCLPPIGQGTIYQFFHTLHTGANTGFSGTNAISSASMDGTTGAVSTNWGCTLGSTTGVAPVQDGSGALLHLPVASVPAGATNRCGFAWTPGYPYLQGNMFTAVKGSSAGGTIFDVYQAVQVKGPSSNCTTSSGGACGTPLITWNKCTTSVSGCSATPTASASVTNATWVSGTATITTSAGAILGQSINVTGITPSGYNCASCAVTAVGSGTRSYAVASNPGAFSVAGTAYGIGTQFCDSQNSADTLPSCSNGIVWQDIGAPDDRSDVVLFTLK